MGLKRIANKKHLKNSITPAASRVVVAITGLIFTPLAFAKLGAESYGIYIMLFSLMGFGGIFSFGLGNATQRFVAKYRALEDESKVRRVIQSNLLVNIIMAFVLVISLYLSTDLILQHVFSGAGESMEDISWTYSFMLLSCMFVLPNVIFKFLMDGFERFDLSSYSETFIHVLVVVTQIVFLLCGYKIVTIALIYLVGRLLLMITSMWIVHRYILPLSACMPRWDKEMTKESLAFGLYLWAESILINLRTGCFPFILGVVISPTAAGLFTLAQKPLSSVMQVVIKGTGFLMPHMTKAFEKKEFQIMRKHYLKSIKIAGFISLCICISFVILAKYAYTLWLQDSLNAQVIVIGSILAISVSFIPINTVASQVLRAGNKGREIILLQLVSFLIFIGAVSVGASYWGLVGVAYATCANIIAGFLYLIVIENTIFHQMKSVKSVVMGINCIAPVAIAVCIAQRYIY